MYRLKKDLPKAGTEVICKQFPPGFCRWFVSIGDEEMCIGDSSMDISDWIEEVPELKDIEMHTTPYLENVKWERLGRLEKRLSELEEDMKEVLDQLPLWTKKQIKEMQGD